MKPVIMIFVLLLGAAASAAPIGTIRMADVRKVLGICTKELLTSLIPQTVKNAGSLYDSKNAAYMERSGGPNGSDYVILQTYVTLQGKYSTCNGPYGGMTIGIDGVLTLSKTYVCSASEPSTSIFNLVSGMNLPVLAYAPAARNPVYDRFGNRLYEEDYLTEVLLIAPQAPAANASKVFLENESTKVMSSIYVDVKGYEACIRRNIKVKDVNF